MEPIDFAERTVMLQRPAGMTEEECGTLPIYRDLKAGCCISCWRPSIRERLSFLFFGRLWIRVYSGVTQPPIAMSAERSIFVREKEDRS